MVKVRFKSALRSFNTSSDTPLVVVLKNPSDFVGAVLGASESNTKAILANAVGKVLIIDEVFLSFVRTNFGADQNL